MTGLLIYRGIARWYTDDGTAGFAFGQSFPWLEWLTTGRSWGVPHSFILFILTALVMGVVLHRSVFGRHLFAVMGTLILLGVLADQQLVRYRRRRAAVRLAAQSS